MGVARKKNGSHTETENHADSWPLEKCLNLNDEFSKLTLPRKIFSEEMFETITKNGSPTMIYCNETLNIMDQMHFLTLLTL